MGVTLLAALALPVSSAQADGWNWDNYCITGSFQVCASVRVFTQSAGTQLVMQVWNLEGTLGQPHTITAIGLYHLGSVPTNVSLNNVQYNGSNISGWTVQGANDIKTLAGFTLQAQAGTGGNSGINGCTTLPGGTKWNTCNTFPGQAYIQFTFGIGTGGTGTYAVGSAPELRWHSQQTGADLEGSLKCDTGGAGDYPPCTVVPEPCAAAARDSTPKTRRPASPSLPGRARSDPGPFLFHDPLPGTVVAPTAPMGQNSAHDGPSFLHR